MKTLLTAVGSAFVLITVCYGAASLKRLGLHISRALKKFVYELVKLALIVVFPPHSTCRQISQLELQRCIHPRYRRHYGNLSCEPVSYAYSDDEWLSAKEQDWEKNS